MGRENYQYLPLTETRYESLKNGEATGNEIYEIRSRIRYTLMNGHMIWREFAPDPNTFETVKRLEGNRRQIEEESRQEARKLQQGLIGWLALLYRGIEDAHHIKLVDYPELEGTHSLEKGPNIYFDFELMLEKAIDKAEREKGRYVTDFSLEVETESIPDTPYEGFDTDELLTRFNDRDPTLTSQEIAYLQQQGEIDGNDWEQYTNEVYDVFE